MRLFFIFFISSLSFSSCSQEMNFCFDRNYEEAIKEENLSEDLIAMLGRLLNNPFITCPNIAEGNLQNCDYNEITDTTWKPEVRLPYDIIFSIFFIQKQYDLCKSYFNNPKFLKIISSIPNPDADAIKWYQKRIMYQKWLISIDDNYKTKVKILQNGNETIRYEYVKTDKNGHEINPIHILDDVQKKMVTVFYHINSWNFCPKKNQKGNLIIHGEYNSQNKEITLYKTACKAKNIYSSNVKDAIYYLRLFFILSHEFGHAIDDNSGKLDNQKRKKAEQKANFIGFVITNSMLELVNYNLNEIDKLLKDKSDILKKHDLEFINCTKSRLNNMQQLFFKLSNKQNIKIPDALKINGCIEFIE